LRVAVSPTEPFMSGLLVVAAMAGTVSTVTDSDFGQFTGQQGLVLVDFWAPWCGPCKRIGPVIEQLSGEMPNVKFGKLNTDENQMTAVKNGVMSIPTLMLYKNGQKVDQVVGAVPKEMLVATLKRHL
jgi:thioredoxin 1